MSLQNKKIKVNGSTYTVRDQSMESKSGGKSEEILILTREVETHYDRPGTIFDLGYTSEDTIHFSDQDVEDTLKMIDSNINNEVQLASIDKSGLINISNVILRGLSLQDTEQYKVSFIEPTSTQNPTIKIDLIFLVKSILLAEQYLGKVQEYNQRISPNDPTANAYEELLNHRSKESSKESEQEIPDFLKQLFEMAGPHAENAKKNKGQVTDKDMNDVMHLFENFFEGRNNGR